MASLLFTFSPSSSLLPNKVSSKARAWNLKSPTFMPTQSERRTTSNPPQRSISLRSALDESPVLDPPPPEFEENKPEVVTSLKLKLLTAVSGLNRGLAAIEDDQKQADSAAKELEAVGGLVDLYTDLDKLQGRWKLIYSSAFSSRTLGGSRPGPPTGRLLPITLGQVFQRIDVLSKDFDNIVELQLGTPWPLPQVEVKATLAHKFELIGSAKVKITFEKTTVTPTGSFSQLPPIELPRLPDGLRPPNNTGNEDQINIFMEIILSCARHWNENLLGVWCFYFSCVG
ncbi:hypothetical protein MRB53_035459 [Persea americana]|uniref:Uncharacterized protein n=1 Tax=Persea americana TaxID=3435 RepID=A0ACC2K4Z6_PERAE|nr:hypothetical protein MRB53_035459 [Persea americana]